MDDLNFFEPYIEKKDMTISKELIFVLIILLLLVFHLIYSIINCIRIRKLSKKVSELYLKVEDEKIQRKMNEILEKEKELDVYREEVSDLKILDKAIKDKDKIDDILIQLIVSRIPEDIFLKSIDIDTDSIHIVGLSKNKSVIAEFQHSLSTVEEFKEIFISNISKEDVYYNFFLNIKIKGVSKDANESSFEKEESIKEEFNEE